MSQRSVVIFDLDGTLTKSALDFDALRAEIGVTGPILEAINEMDPDQVARANEILNRHEAAAARNCTLFEGAVDVLAACRKNNRPVALLTRNSRATVHTVLGTHALVVDAVRTREDGAIKPSAEPIFSICRELNADPTRSWMVGDYHFDIMSGRSAGTRTVLMLGDKPRPDYADEADHVIRRLAELLPFVNGT